MIKYYFYKIKTIVKRALTDFRYRIRNGHFGYTSIIIPTAVEQVCRNFLYAGSKGDFYAIGIFSYIITCIVTETLQFLGVDGDAG